MTNPMIYGMTNGNQTIDVVGADHYWAMKASRDSWQILARYLLEDLEQSAMTEEIEEMLWVAEQVHNV